MSTRKLLHALVGTALMLSASFATAVPMLTLTNGTTTTCVVDQNASSTGCPVGSVVGSDAAPGAAGMVHANGTVGSWLYNFTIGLGRTFYPDEDELHLNSLNISGSGGWLEIAFTDTGFAPNASGPTRLWSGIGGLTGGSVSYWMYIDAANNPFARTTEVGWGSGTSAFSGSFGNDFGLSGPFSMTLVARISHGGWGVTSFDFAGRVPEPGTLSLLGLALVALGFAARRKK